MKLPIVSIAFVVALTELLGSRMEPRFLLVLVPLTVLGLACAIESVPKLQLKAAGIVGAQ